MLHPVHNFPVARQARRLERDFTRAGEKPDWALAQADVILKYLTTGIFSDGEALASIALALVIGLVGLGGMRAALIYVDRDGSGTFDIAELLNPILSSSVDTLNLVLVGSFLLVIDGRPSWLSIDVTQGPVGS